MAALLLALVAAACASSIAAETSEVHSGSLRRLRQSDCSDDSCVGEFEKCGGKDFNVSVGCCDEGTACYVKNWYYAQCITPERAAENVAGKDAWDGRILTCEEMPEDAPKGPGDLTSRRSLLDAEPACDDGECVEMFEKCGGKDFNVSVGCCNPETSCVVKNWYYAQCITAERAEKNMEEYGWDGRVLTCEEMPADAPKGPGDLTSRRSLLDSGCDDGECVPEFEKCGGKDFNVSVGCCDEGTACYVKNWYYAQCITPERAAENVAGEDAWDGRILTCEEMPEDAPKGPGDLTSSRRSLLDAGLYGCDDGDCVGLFEKCGGKDFNVSVGCCDPMTSCVVKNYYYAQCITDERAEKNVDEYGWDGRVLACEEMPVDAPKGPGDLTSRRALLDTGCEDGECVEEFEKCGGKDFNVSVGCCDPETSCVVKNWYYAQCLTAERAEKNVEEYGWDGRVLTCEEMPADAPKSPGDLTSRRSLLDDCDDGDCVEEFAQCGGADDFNVSVTCCDPAQSCVVKNYFYAHCLTDERAAINVAEEGWDGRVLMCEEMPEDAPKGPGDLTSSRRSLLDAGLYGCEDGECVEMFEKCGGKDFNVSVGCCDPMTSCVVKNYYYAQCITDERAEKNVEEYGWDGRVLACEEMPVDAPKGPGDLTASRRSLLDAGCEDGECAGLFDKCGGKDFNVSIGCCDPDTSCVVKNWYYAQCITAERAEKNIAEYGWDGRELTCEEMPADAPKGPGALTSRRSLLGYEDDCDDGDCVGLFEKCGGVNFNTSVTCCDSDQTCIVKNFFYAQCLPKRLAVRNIDEFGWDGRELICEDMPGDAAGGPESWASAHRSLLDAGCEGECVPIFDKCGGKDFNTSVPCCDEGTACYVKNWYYAQCLTPERAAANVARGDWDGTVLDCEEMPATVLRGPDTSPPPMSMSDCEDCVWKFDKCGGSDIDVGLGCCDPETSCYVKNKQYAQCLTAERAEWNAQYNGWGEPRILSCGEKMFDDLE